MKERPILFSGEMVRAILDGRKTQTRRVMKPQPKYAQADYRDGITPPAESTYEWPPQNPRRRFMDQIALDCPIGQPCDRLWVRENWAASRLYDLCPPRSIPTSADIFYAANGGEDWNHSARIRPSIHMPRWASRITLEITGVRVERLQDISEEDAKAEGLRYHHIYNEWGGVEVHPDSTASAPQWRWYESPVEAFKQLWISINGPDSWNATPWVWVVELRRIEQ